MTLPLAAQGTTTALPAVSWYFCSAGKRHTDRGWCGFHRHYNALILTEHALGPRNPTDGEMPSQSSTLAARTVAQLAPPMPPFAMDSPTLMEISTSQLETIETPEILTELGCGLVC